MIDVRTPEGVLLGRGPCHANPQFGQTVRLIPCRPLNLRHPGGVVTVQDIEHVARVGLWCTPSAPDGVPAIKWHGAVAQLRNIRGFVEHTP